VSEVQGSSPSSLVSSEKECGSCCPFLGTQVARGKHAPFLLPVLTLLPTVCAAAPSAVGEGQSGLFYALTHLHPLAYFILFLIFVLSVVNLVLQEQIPGKRSLISVWGKNWGKKWRKAGKKAFSGPAAKRPVRRGGDPARHRDARSQPETESAVVQVRPQASMGGPPDKLAIATPLDGINHPMPQFGSRALPQAVVRPVTGSPPREPWPTKAFKVQSAVDVVGPEEKERRDKKQLVVSGSVTDSRGAGIGSVIVYLTDEEGRRHGQSCRTHADTGTFKVIAEKPGKYQLHAYKRGYAQEKEGPLALPAEAGRIEGMNVMMIPEACSVEGQVFDEASGAPLAGVRVKCVCRGDLFSCSGYTGEEGEFLLTGIPINSECQLQVIGPDHGVLGWSSPFETVQKRNIHQDVVIASADAATAADPVEATEPVLGPVSGDPAEAFGETGRELAPARQFQDRN
jgi:hypothetical protein